MGKDEGFIPSVFFTLSPRRPVNTGGIKPPARQDQGFLGLSLSKASPRSFSRNPCVVPRKTGGTKPPARQDRWDQRPGDSWQNLHVINAGQDELLILDIFDRSLDVV